MANLYISHYKRSRYVHLYPHAEETGDWCHPAVYFGHHGDRDDSSEQNGVDKEEDEMGPSSSDFIGHDNPHNIAWALHQTQEEQVHEGVAVHVGHID